jgi:hypothetical protein
MWKKISEKIDMWKHENFWLILIGIGTYFVFDAAINNKLVTLIAGFVFWWLGYMAFGMKNKD